MLQKSEEGIITLWGYFDTMLKRLDPLDVMHKSRSRSPI